MSIKTMGTPPLLITFVPSILPFRSSPPIHALRPESPTGYHPEMPHFWRYEVRVRSRAVACLLAIAAALSGCASSPAIDRPPVTHSRAAAPAGGGPLAALEERVRSAHGSDRSGFLLLDSNEDGLRWRLALIDSARHTLDIQYYVWWGDEAGELLMRRVLAAANRGVKVRMVVDDLSTILEDETHPRVRDATFALLDGHRNISVRLFNTWRERSLAGRAAEIIERMERLNHRMHNKLLVADNRAAVIGGRNVGNEYFGLSTHFNFRDVDVLGAGPVARQASEVFDAFWNSQWVVDAARTADAADTDAIAEAAAELASPRLAAAPGLARFPLERGDWDAELQRASATMHAGTSRMHTDRPDGDVLAHHMPEAIRALLGTARREILLTNAYIIPGERAVEDLRGITSRGVRVKVLTNSLASHDVPAVNSHYKAWRRPLIEAGVELHEARHDAAVRPLLADTRPTVSGFMGLHSKAIVIDRERVFVGSMNLDPRSAEINSEMGVVIDSRGLAQEMAQAMERDMRGDNAWRVTLDSTGNLVWSNADVTANCQPARHWTQRVEDIVFMAFPRDLY
jgi:putative cardiolipin synthase